MVTKRIRSEYMKKFKDPKWETYTKCYEEMLKYRLNRRLLEHSHNPWFWNGTDSDSDSGGSSPPPCQNQGAESGGGGTGAELAECAGARMKKQQQPGDVPRLPLLQEDEEDNANAAHGSHLDGRRETRAPEEQRASSRGSQQITAAHRGPEGDPGVPRRQQQSKPPKVPKQRWRLQRVKPALPEQTREDSKDRKHPFALYGSGEKDADIAGRRTHNVGPAASTNEIYESALRAKTRREVERQIQTQRAERRRAKSADLGKARNVVQPEFNPWLTEYMRCFSARSR